MSNRERQAAFRERRRRAPAEARAEVETLRGLVEVPQRERDRLENMVGFVLKREEWDAASQHAGACRREG